MKTERLQAAAAAPALEAAWRYIQADLRVAMARRDRLREGRMKFREWLRGPSLRTQLEQCDAEASKLTSMLRSIDAVRSEVRKLEEQSHG